MIVIVVCIVVSVLVATIIVLASIVTSDAYYNHTCDTDGIAHHHANDEGDDGYD